MPTFPGFIPLSPVQISDWTRITDALDDYVLDYWPAHDSIMGDTPQGPLSAQYPVTQDAARTVAGGVIAPQFGRDWYERIHLVPQTINLGNLISPQSRPVEVWNAYFTSQALNAITPTDATGLTLSGQPAPPLSFAPLQSRLYALDATVKGPPVVDARYDVEFAVATVTLRVVGRRIVTFGVRPNWVDDVIERLEWSTDLHEAYDGTEQRIALVAAPRRRYEYSLLEHTTDAAHLDALLFGWSGRTYCLPLWTDPTVTTAPLTAGALSLPVPEVADQDWHEDGLAVLWRSTTEHEAVEVDSVGAGSVTIKLPLAQSWPAGTRIYPARIVRLDGRALLSHPTDQLTAARLAWRCEDVDVPTAAGYGTTYRGFRVFDWRPDRATEPTSDWSRKLAELDYGGLPTVDDESGNPVLLRRFSWLLHGRSAITTFRRWLAERRGRVTPFWIPSYQDDLRVTAPIASADSSLRVQAIGVASLVAASPLRRDLLIKTRTATFYRRVNSVAELSATEDGLVLDSPLGTTFQPSDFVAVQWLSLVRLDADAIELAWITDTLCRIDLTMRVLPA